ncbi:aminoglycoside phosphotransferase family protein [Geoalkalibacter halelectricus]|uniref:Aminoglycoside phosphotransferase family protein n=1 Tax=Geoalkalibacter halelectricus TaxID=2847045 RepID=A0ABY5ZMU1_9BACT|nr:aminoglycoside phosphotransferase family protein [Geoalkalibacter halelectricus]MDO3379733.1 aminoglycoside phosphotransferase family protein [Geoalkalibacter halelectricus]UWZ79267.1 aminoglycoside phosphotransferase family protein [Geoalkalibacter halelectricus]
MSGAEYKSEVCAIPWFSALYPKGELKGVNVVRSSCVDELGDASALLKEGLGLHVVFEEGGRVARALRLAKTIRNFSHAGLACQVVGLVGAVERPQLAAPLRRPILRYVGSVAFRGTDSPARAFLKRIIGFLPMSLVWQGPLVLVAASSLDTFDRFALLTGDRQIVFLFKPGVVAPWAVCKSGNFEALDVERRNHAWAVRLLGKRVPALLKEDVMGGLTMEALPERLLGNMVAQAWMNRREVFVREACRHFEFCREVYQSFVKGGSLERAEVGAGEIDGLIDGISQLLQDSPNAGQLTDALKALIGVSLPRMIQHCDFCVRNVLVVGGDRDRVLIDWEDMQARCWPLADFALLHLSLKGAYAAMFKTPLSGMEDHPAISRAIAETRAKLAGLLDLDERGMRQATLLSLAYLCRQNLMKQRQGTARNIFAELERMARG